MGSQNKTLSAQIADEILEMITVKKRFQFGDKLPNENELSLELEVSRTTLREAVRILVAHNVLEIRRGKGTYVVQNGNFQEPFGLGQLTNLKTNLQDLFEMRFIFEPKIAYYAAIRATDKELSKILQYGCQVEEKIVKGEDRTQIEQLFHNSIAKATHNEFMHRLMPIINQSIDKAVKAGKALPDVIPNTISDHKLLMEFLKSRNPQGAETAMKLHILHAIEAFGLSNSK